MTEQRDEMRALGSLASEILELEEDRIAESQAARADEPSVLPGMGEEAMTLRQALGVGGKFTFFMFATLAAVDNLESSTLGTLAPDIQRSLNMSDGTIVFISAAAGSFLILGSVPMGWMADRFPRSRIIGWATAIFGAMVFASGLAANAFMLFLTRLGAGLSKSNQYVVQGTVTADTYPITTRGRVGAAMSLAGGVTGALSPLLVGGIAALAGGGAGWRWAYLTLSIPVLIAAVFAFRTPDPPRGQWEKKDVLGEIIEDARPAPISMEAGFARLLQIRTLKTVFVAFASLGFGMFTVPILGSLFLEREYGLGSFGRGLVGTTSGIFVLAVAPFVGSYYDRLYRRDPSKALRLVGQLILPLIIVVPIQFFMPNPILYGIIAVPQQVMIMSAFAMTGPLITSVTPYQLRGIGSSLGSLYIFLIGGTGGALLSGALSNMYGPRTAILVIYIPSTLVGGVMMVRGSQSIRSDLALIAEELRAEREDHDRMAADPEHIPALQVRGIDFSYDAVQILFNVSFEVQRGEVLALLGTNGAGKSTILRVIAGLGIPARGAVRLNGRTITFVSPEIRTRLGIRMLPGGKGVFADMSVVENLQVAAYNYRSDRDDIDRRLRRVFDLLPELEDKRDHVASNLSGGQQQLLALGRVLLAEPEVLIIDELSLGLAPVMVQRLLDILRELKRQGLTIIVVEQSLNVAAAVADRAVFMEKGHVRFEGAMADLIERDDLARAVFLGAEGG